MHAGFTVADDPSAIATIYIGTDFNTFMDGQIQPNFHSGSRPGVVSKPSTPKFATGPPQQEQEKETAAGGLIKGHHERLASALQGPKAFQMRGSISHPPKLVSHG